MSQTQDSIHYDQMVCSGGGTRCFWQGGFLDVVRDGIDLSPVRISAVSGGALTGAGFITRKGRDVLDAMMAAFAHTDANVTLHDLTHGTGSTPHQRIYREVVGDVFDAAACRIVANGPSFQVLIGRPPLDRAPKLSGSAAALAYEAELHLIGNPHFNWAEKIGVTAELVDARQAARDGRLVDLICAAAVIPPVFDPPLWDGRPVIDGGMADQAPLPQPDEGSTLILLTRDYARIPQIETRHYVRPSHKVEADKIDFTDPDKIARTWAQGEADGREFLKTRKTTQE
ncbi:patatin-like phospholipase family protein [Sulfitobacter sabulilitoris]|uniref:Patatin-like phospholipase family protein n=1 Tax=Sulfitobacter sabulilitoris TaxID=2562655 RepID=A0A5S3QEA9_9RHOB|nr:patatin-like phospholipase family protein [Sulfitobacter sabulilitoris]TMM55492.1 patatin-like phospholipase family protein [Sulfitobacter sabulilitoris]